MDKENSIYLFSSPDSMNVKKCLNAGYSRVCVISKDENHLKKIEEGVDIEMGEQKSVRFISFNQVPELLNIISGEEKEKEARVKGYRVKVKYTM